MMKFVVIAAVIAISYGQPPPPPATPSPTPWPEYSTDHTMCIGKATGYYPHPAACGAILVCSNGYASQKHCPENLVFMPNSPNNGRCEYSGCTEPNTRTPSTSCIAGTYGDSCQCTGPDPCEMENCNGNGVCKYKWNCNGARCDCNGNWRGNTCNRQIATPAPSDCPDLCDVRGPGFSGNLADPNNPNHYVTCWGGTLIGCMPCPAGLVWSQGDGYCNWSANNE